MYIPARIKYIVLTLLFVFATVNFVRTTLNVLESSKRLDTLRSSVSELENEKVLLEDELVYKESVDFVEKEARNKLNLAKPGEQLFIVPNVLSSVTHRGEVVTGDGEKSNVLLWYDLLF